ACCRLILMPLDRTIHRIHYSLFTISLFQRWPSPCRRRSRRVLDRYIIDEPGLAEPGRGENPKRLARNANDRREVASVAKGEVVDPESGLLQVFPGARDGIVDGLAMLDRTSRRGEGTVEVRSRLPLGRREIGVARGEGEAVGFADGRISDDLDRQV